MKKSVFHILVWTIALTALGAATIRTSFWSGSTAEALGDLTIDWGVPAGDPIFTVDDAKPGDIEARDVSVTNNATITRTVGVRTDLTANTGIGDVLDIVILVEGAAVYGTGSPTGPKALSEFFIDSSTPEGYSLTELSARQTKTINFKVSFNKTVGNAFQNRTVTFDITLGVTGQQSAVPAECSHIVFDSPPIFGTDGTDSIRGTAGNDLIFGLEGTDTIRGLGGDDCIIGGNGTDTLRGNNGNDVLFGEEGTDSLRGGDGDDLLYGGAGVDSLKGEKGNDKLYGGSEDDSLKGYSGDDFLYGEAGDDSLKGGSGNDVLTGGPGTDVAHGQSGTDTCSAEVEKSCEL